MASGSGNRRIIEWKDGRPKINLTHDACTSDGRPLAARLVKYGVLRGDTFTSVAVGKLGQYLAELHHREYCKPFDCHAMSGCASRASAQSRAATSAGLARG